MPEAGKSGESQNGFDSWIRPYVVESTLWPLLIVVLASLAAFVAPVVLFALRDRHIPAMAALTALLVASGRAIGVDVAKRRTRLGAGPGGVGDDRVVRLHRGPLASHLSRGFRRTPAIDPGRRRRTERACFRSAVGEDADLDASYVLWSSTEPFVAVALLQLIEAGHADLDPETQAALMPGAGGISRAGQGVRFYRALLDEGEGPGGRMLSPEMVRAAAFPHAVGSVDRTFEIDIP